MTIFSSEVPLSQRHADQLAVDQGKIGIRERGARQHRVSRTIDGHIDKVDLARILVGAAIGKQQCRLDARHVEAFASLLDPQEFALAYRKGDIHRILTDDDGQRPALRRDHVAFGNISPADLARNRRNDLGITKIDPGGLQIGLIDEKRAFGRFIGGERLVAAHLSPGSLPQQFLGALQLSFGQGLRGLVFRQGTFSLSDGSLEQPLFDAVERRSFLDEIALLERNFLEISCDPRFTSTR